MQLQIIRIEVVAEHIHELSLARADGATLPGFTPGSHIELTLPGSIVRQYSLVSSPQDLSAYEIAVLHTERSRGGSRWLHESAKVGDVLEVSTPRGSFRLAERAARHTLIAGGIGITPIYAFASHLRARGAEYRIHYAARSRERMAFADELARLHGERLACHVDHDGRTTMDVARILGSAADGHHAYVCGPRAMIEAVRVVAARLGWRDDHVHVESFGAATSSGQAVRLRLVQSDLDIDVPAGASLLEAMEQAGAWVGSECRRGECGKCTVGYADGEVEHLDVCLTDHARRTQFCPCVSRARSNVLVVDA